MVGGGIVGLAAARELSRRHAGLRIAVLERAAALGGQTGQTSGVIHAGIYYEPGSLKARLCVEGARELYAYCEERGIPAARAKADRRDARARAPRQELERRARANRVEGVRMLAERDRGRGAARVRHQGAPPPATGTVDFRRVTAALAEDLSASGGSVAHSCEVRGIRDEGPAVQVKHARGTTAARALVVCAGSTRTGWPP